MVETFSYNFWFGWGLLLFSLFTLVLFIRSFIKDSKARRWPTVTARVVGKRIEEAFTGGEPGGMENPIVEYAYEVNGVSYAQNASYSGGWRKTMPPGKANDLLSKMGDSITIYYNPQNPNESCMYILSRWYTVPAQLFAVVGILWALILLFP